MQRCSTKCSSDFHLLLVLALQVIPLSVRSPVGGPALKHATIYSHLGKVMMRLRPSANDTHHIGMSLYLNAVIQKQLVLVVEDVGGGKAVSFPYRSIKAGGRQPVFCGDHTNGAAMAKGVTSLPVISWTVPMPLEQVGVTWDGGPSSVGVKLELLVLATTRPELLSDAGHQDQRYFTQTPRVEYSDEGSMAITSIQDRMVADVVNQPTDEVSSILWRSQP